MIERIEGPFIDADIKMAAEGPLSVTTEGGAAKITIDRLTRLDGTKDPWVGRTNLTRDALSADVEVVRTKPERSALAHIQIVAVDPDNPPTAIVITEG